MRGSRRGSGARAARARGARSGRVRRPLPAPALGRAAPARGRGPRARRGPAAAAARRAVRGARPDHPGRAAARVQGARGPRCQGHGVRDARRARRPAARDPDRPDARGTPGVPGDAGGVPRLRSSGVSGVHECRMSLVQFYTRNTGEVLALIGQHLYLVAISTGVAIAVGLPLGILLTRRPRWRGPVLGLTNVFQTIPSLALFGFLIPLPFIGGIGARTAIVALVLFFLLSIVENRYLEFFLHDAVTIMPS